MKSNLKKALFSLRLGVFIVMFMWTIDKFVNPGRVGVQGTHGSCRLRRVSKINTVGGVLITVVVFGLSG